MGLAIIRGLMRQGHHNILVIDPKQERRDLLRQQLGITVLPQSPTLKDDAIAVLAMPPQAFADFAKTSPIPRNHRGPVVSVMTGVKLATIAESLGVTQIVRSIPKAAPVRYPGRRRLCGHHGAAP